MRLSSRTVKWAYLLYGTLALLVIGVLGWATIASLQLEQREQQVAAASEYEARVRQAMYLMEYWANPILFSEIQRKPSDYAALYYTEHARFVTGETLRPGTIVEPSPLLLYEPAHKWIVLYFQASPRSGYRSPQMLPELARSWPGRGEDLDDLDHQKYAQMLARLQYAYSVDELLAQYEQAGGQVHNWSVGNADAVAGPRLSKEVVLSRRETLTAIQQRGPPPAGDCAPQVVVAQNILAAQHDSTSPLVSELTPDDDRVGVNYKMMLNVWLDRIGGDAAIEPAGDLAFVRAVITDGETALQGFIVDWSQFSAALLSRVAHLFPDAEIEVVAAEDVSDPDARQDDTAFGFIPRARLRTNAEPQLAGPGWSSTHGVLVLGWSAALILLAGLGVGIRSVVGLSERRSQFAYAVTHELRTPLTTFQLYTDMLANGLVAPPNQQEYFDTLNDESRRLTDLVTGVLEYSRIENNSLSINLAHATIGEILEQVREHCLPRCRRAGMTLRIDDRGRGAEGVATDRQLASQIIANLVDNACKYGRNDAAPYIDLTVERLNGEYRFEITDHGPGIPPRLRTAIFRPYRRGDAPNTPITGGIGLGLALSRSWARLLGGRLELVTSESTQAGARFRFALPAAS